MALDQKDLQSIKSLLQEQKQEIKQELIAEVEVMLDRKLAKQTEDIAQVINQVMATADEQFVTKAELAQVERRLTYLERRLSN